MPISAKQLAANRANARKSTGPRTPQGKAVSSMNALRHGVFARSPVLPGDDPAEFERFVRGFLDDLKPVGELEHTFVRRMAETAWRLRRFPFAEIACFTADAASPPRLRPGADPLAGISRRESRLHRQFHRDFAYFRTARELRLQREASVLP